MMKTFTSILILTVFFVYAREAAAQEATSSKEATSSQEAVIRELTGTVELRQAGSSDWTAARSGDRLTKGMAISTSFRSTAVLAVGNSLLTVRPLTKLTLEEFIALSGAEQVKLNLQTGRLKADVKPPTDGRTEFTIRGPMATASVRGTEFEMDTVNITVTEGAVAYAGADGRTVIAEGGLEISTDPMTGTADNPMAKAAGALSTAAGIATATGVTSSGGARSTGSPSVEDGILTINAQWE